MMEHILWTSQEDREITSSGLEMKCSVRKLAKMVNNLLQEGNVTSLGERLSSGKGKVPRITNPQSPVEWLDKNVSQTK